MNDLLTDYNDTTIAYPSNETFIDLFSEQVHRTPNALALTCGADKTHKELDILSEQLAVYLQCSLGSRGSCGGDRP
ncbi:hypothetical protein CK934_23300 [Chitinophaga sp. MD30]|nr:hypothetical protein CK934_23300 [Chitinophaga sp. MD30]